MLTWWWCVRGSPESGRSILWVTWTSTIHFSAIHPIVRPTDWRLHPAETPGRPAAVSYLHQSPSEHWRCLCWLSAPQSLIEEHLNPSSHTERESSLLSPHCLKNVRKKQNPSTQPITRGLIASIQEAGSSTWRESSPRRNHGGIGNDAPLRPCESRGGREGGTNGSWCKIKHE